MVGIGGGAGLESEGQTRITRKRQRFWPPGERCNQLALPGGLRKLYGIIDIDISTGSGLPD